MLLLTKLMFIKINFYKERGENLTEREEQILRIIKENPMISQNEIAKKTGITRSSVAVHISNLMKKGFIKGKSYVLNSNNSIVVVGGANIDIFGKPHSKISPKDSSPGKVKYTLGGVGRNIAHNLSLLTSGIKLITLFGDDIWSKSIDSSCKTLGIDTTDCMFVENESTSTYLFITDEGGEMLYAVSDMDILDRLTVQFLKQRINSINRQSVCVCDTNLPLQSIEYLFNNTTCPVFVDSVSTAKAAKLHGLLDKVHTLKPNILEAEILSGVKITTDEDVKTAANKLLELGVKQVFITMGSKGVYAASNKYSKAIECYGGNVVNTTGCGDAFTAGIAWAFLNSANTEQQAKCGLAAASICAASGSTVSDNISAAAINEITGLTF